MDVNSVSRIVVNSAMRVHTSLGPGLLESAYQACLAHELRNQGLTVQAEVPVPVVYEGIKLECGYRMDLLVNGCLVVELKAVDALAPIHLAQLLSHLKLSGRKLGLLINFNVLHLKDGIKRVVNGL